MIHLFNRHTAEKRSFQDNDGLFKFIKDREYSKLFEVSPESSSFGWSFRVFKRKSIFELYHHIKEEDLSLSIRQAYEQQLDLLEICKGNLSNPVQIPLFPDIDVGYLQKTWCFEYCKAHGYEVKEDFYRADNTNHSLLPEKEGEYYADF